MTAMPVHVINNDPFFPSLSPSESMTVDWAVMIWQNMLYTVGYGAKGRIGQRLIRWKATCLEDRYEDTALERIARISPGGQWQHGDFRINYPVQL